MTKYCRLVERLPTEFGSSPLSLLTPTSNNSKLLQLVRLLMNPQSDPFLVSSWFSAKVTTDKFFWWTPRQSGIVPDKKLCTVWIHWIIEALQREGGIMPWKWFSSAKKYWSFGRVLPKSGGKDPFRLLPCKTRDSREERLNIEVGKGPSSPLYYLSKF